MIVTIRFLIISNKLLLKTNSNEFTCYAFLMLTHQAINNSYCLMTFTKPNFRLQLLRLYSYSHLSLTAGLYYLLI